MRLSISQINMFKKCPACWTFKYIDEIQERKPFNLIRGQAIHQTIADYYRKKNSGELNDIEVIDVAYSSIEVLNRLLREEQLDDVDQELLNNTASQMIELLCKYLEQEQKITAVELPISYTIDDIEITGFIDMITEDSVIIDIKTVNRSASEISQEYISQLAMYSLATQIPDCRIDYFIFKKNPAIETKTVTITNSHIKYINNTIKYVADAISKGIKYPNREHPFCSEAFCSYWNVCHEYYG